MKLKAKNLNAKKLLNGNTEFTIEVDDKQNKLISQLNGQKQLFNSELEVVIEKWRNKRSGGHNRLFWDMCGLLSEHINDPLITQYTIYRGLVRECGVSTIYPVEDELLDLIIKDWENRGDGWQTEIQRKSRIDDSRTVVKFWFGSSIYNSKQFWKLVEGLKALCNENGLDISMYDQPMQQSIKEMEEKERKLEEEKSNGDN